MQFTVLYKLVVNVVMPAGLFEQFNNIHLALSSLPQYYNDLFQLGLQYCVSLTRNNLVFVGITSYSFNSHNKQTDSTYAAVYSPCIYIYYTVRWPDSVCIL